MGVCYGGAVGCTAVDGAGEGDAIGMDDEDMGEGEDEIDQVAVDDGDDDLEGELEAAEPVNDRGQIVNITNKENMSENASSQGNLLNKQAEGQQRANDPILVIYN